MLPTTHRNTPVLLIITVLIAASLACNVLEMVADAEIELSTVDLPDTSAYGADNGEKEPDHQAYMGTSQIENISVEPIEAGEDCPPENVDFNAGGVVHHKMNGDTLIATDKSGSREYSYDPLTDAFCREVPTQMIINQDVVETKVTECASFHTANGTKVFNLRRYYLRNDVNILCYDQHNRMNNEAGGLSAPETELTLVEQCLASPKMYEVEFANINHDFSNESKEVCQGDFIIQNLSSETLSLRYYNISDNGAMRSEGWTHVNIGLEPGKSTERYFGTQKWTDGSSTIDTITELIVVLSSMDCTNLLRDKNIALWGEHAIPLDDPCR